MTLAQSIAVGAVLFLSCVIFAELLYDVWRRGE